MIVNININAESRNRMARIFVANLEFYKEAKLANDSISMSMAKYNCSASIRRWVELIELTPNPFLVSKEALLIAETKGISKEKMQITNYKMQTKVVKNGGLGEISKKNGKFHFEHFAPVSYILKKLEGIEDLTPQKFCDVMDNIAQGAWITKEEMKRLDKINKSGKRTEEELKMANIEWA